MELRHNSIFMWFRIESVWVVRIGEIDTVIMRVWLSEINLVNVKGEIQRVRWTIPGEWCFKGRLEDGSANVGCSLSAVVGLGTSVTPLIPTFCIIWLDIGDVVPTLPCPFLLELIAQPLPAVTRIIAESVCLIHWTRNRKQQFCLYMYAHMVQSLINMSTADEPWNLLTQNLKRIVIT